MVLQAIVNVVKIHGRVLDMLVVAVAVKVVNRVRAIGMVLDVRMREAVMCYLCFAFHKSSLLRIFSCFMRHLVWRTFVDVLWQVVHTFGGCIELRQLFLTELLRVGVKKPLLGFRNERHISPRCES